LKIRGKSSTGIVGLTGSGKTTLVDILLGLLRPSSGELLLDGEVINEANVARWQASVGYVPQNIYLCDDTITKNIALGVEGEDIDIARVEYCAKVAQIDDFIQTELPDGYNTVVGEQGIRLSGGQRQRLGIARAIYHEPTTLVLDEATSSLDGITEHSILGGLRAACRDTTLVMVAHRFSTLVDCEQIYVLDNKAGILAAGSFDELMTDCREFQQMARTLRRRESEACVSTQ